MFYTPYANFKWLSDYFLYPYTQNLILTIREELDLDGKSEASLFLMGNKWQKVCGLKT